MSVTWPENYVAPIAHSENAMISLVGMDKVELAQALSDVGVPAEQIRMRVSQIYRWIYARGVQSFSEMINVSKSVLEPLSQKYSLERPEIIQEQISEDGTRKWLIKIPATHTTKGHAEVECVYIPEQERGTLCVSSQVGCTLTCSFCHTGTQKMVRNLTSREIVAQLMLARDVLGDWPGQKPPEGAFVPRDGSRFVTNIVMMGMGEPLYNFEEVKRALLNIGAEDGLAVSKRKITLSTAGVVPNIQRCGEEIGVMLAVSLHATRDALRNELVPINKKYNLEELMNACRNYPGVSNSRRITFEYVMLKGVNDTVHDAKALVNLLKGVHAKINLIPFNPWPGSQYECSDWETIEKFANVVAKAGYASPIRTPRGRDIFAACGQLKSETEKLKANLRTVE